MDSSTKAGHDMDPPAKRQYQRISSQQWEKQKPHILDLYMNQQKTLDDVARIMQEEHGFVAK